MKTATSLLKRGENAVVVFTHGKYLSLKRDGSGSTGNWVINKNRRIKKVVIYERTKTGNEIYIARPTSISGSRDPGRYVIKFADMRYFGNTYFNWPEFSGSRNPVRYWQPN